MYREIKIIVRASALVCFVLCAQIAHAQMTGSMGGTIDQTGPALPHELIASTLNATNFPDIVPTPSVTKTVCASGCSYTSIVTAFANASTDAPTCGELIQEDVVSDGFSETFSGGTSSPISYTMTCPTGKHIVWQAKVPANLNAQGVKLTPANISTFEPAMAQINYSCSVTSCKFVYPIQIADGASGLVMDGIECSVSGTNVAGCVKAGSGTNSTNFCNHFWLSRSYLHGPLSYSTLINNLMNNDCFFVSITDSLFDGTIETLADGGSTYSESHDFLQYNSAGPVKLVNNTLGGCPTENFLFGGATSANPLVGPGDVEIRNNSVWKDFNSSTCQLNGAVKNLLEWKKGSRVLVVGNTFQYSWSSLANGGEQNGASVDFNVAATAAGDIGSEVADIFFEDNVIQHVAVMSNMQGSSVDSKLTQWPVTKRVTVTNDLYQDLGLAWSVLWGSCQTATAAFTDGNGHLIFDIPNTVQFIGAGGTTLSNPIVATGFAAPSLNFNVYLAKISAGSAGVSIAVPFADGGSAQSASALGQVCPSQSNVSHAGVAMNPGIIYWTPGGFPHGQIPTTAGVITSGSSSNIETLTFASDPALPPANSLTGFFVGCNVSVNGFSGSDTSLNVSFGSLVRVSSINESTLQISFPTTAAAHTATTNGTVQCEQPIPGPYYVTLSNNGVYGSLCPSSANCAASGVGGANGETLGVFNSQLGTGGDSVANGVWPYYSWFNNVAVVDQDSPKTDSGQSINTLSNNGALPNFCASGNVVVDPAGTYFSAFPASGCAAGANNTAHAGSTSNPSAISTFLGMSNYSLCVAGDLTLGSVASITNCELTGTFAADGPNIPLILSIMALGNDDTTLTGKPRVAQ